MKIREFFAVTGFDPENCGFQDFFESTTGVPICPLAQCAVLRGYYQGDWSSSEDGIAQKFMISRRALRRFWQQYDQLRGSGTSKKTAFITALDFAENFEKKVS